MSQGDLGAYLQLNTPVFQPFTQVGGKRWVKMRKKCAKMQEIKKKCKKLQLFERFFCTRLLK